MCKKTMLVMCLVVVLSMAMKASAIGCWWFTNAGGDQRWDNLVNWVSTESPITLPSYETSAVYLGVSPTTASVPVIIDGTMDTASFWGLSVGVNTSAEADIVSGGKCGIPGSQMFVGCNEWVGTSNGHGVVNIDGVGSVGYGESWTIASGNVAAANCGSGIVNITNGGQMVLGWWGSFIGTKGTGTVNIINGTMTYWGGGLTIGTGGRIVLYPGTKFDLKGDQTTLVNGLIVQGRITSNSSRCSLVVVYDEDFDWTHVTSTCTCTTFKTADFNHDCYVDFLDFAVFAQEWLTCYDWQNPECECLSSLCAGLETGSHQAITPVARSNSWWQQRHADILSQLATHPPVNLVFIGDSITQSFDPTVWNQYYASYNPLNLGFSGDMTQNVLWRLENGEINGISPKLAVILIGTNNTCPPAGQVYSAEEIADGIMAICCTVRRNLPNTKILILAIFPRGEYPSAERNKNAAASILASQIADSKTIYYMDINSHFLDPNSRLSTSIFPDFLHPNAAGDTIWADAIKPTIQNLMGF